MAVWWAVVVRRTWWWWGVSTPISIIMVGIGRPVIVVARGAVIIGWVPGRGVVIIVGGGSVVVRRGSTMVIPGGRHIPICVRRRPISIPAATTVLTGSSSTVRQWGVPGGAAGSTPGWWSVAVGVSVGGRVGRRGGGLIHSSTPPNGRRCNRVVHMCLILQQ